MPAYNSQALSNTMLQAVAMEDPAPAIILSAETPAANAASLAVAIRPNTMSGGPRNISVQFDCPLGIGAGVFQVQESDVYTVSGVEFTSVNFGGAAPGLVNGAAFITPGGTSAKVTLQLRARFVRVLCITPPTNPVTAKVSG